MPMIQLRCGFDHPLEKVDFANIDRLQQAVLSINKSLSKV